MNRTLYGVGAALLFALNLISLSFAADDLPRHPTTILVRLKQEVQVPAGGIQAAKFQNLSSSVQNVLANVNATYLRPLISRRPTPQGSLSGMSAARFSSYADALARTYLIEIANPDEFDSALSFLQKNPSVEVAEPNYEMQLFNTPNDTNFSQQWHLLNTGQSGGTAGKDIGATLAWDAVTGSNTVVVAIIDSGTDWDHVDLASNIWSNTDETDANSIDDDGNGKSDDIRGWDFGSNDNNPDDDCFNANSLINADGHGTHVSGILGAVGNNGAGVSGVVWGAQIMPVKVADNDCRIYTSVVAEGIDYARANGANIINMSLGGGSSAALTTAVGLADAAGILMVAAAGNEGTSDQTTSYPAAYTEVVGVAALDRNDVKSSFSNYGSWVSIAAPGSAIYSTKPGNTYGEKSGTSMASPMVAGVAALIKSQYPSMSLSDLKSRLLSRAFSVDSLNSSYTGQLGSGRVFAPLSLVQVDSISPTQGLNSNASLSITASGISLVPGMTLSLTRSGQTTITGSGLTVNNPNSVSATFNLTDAATGTWSFSASSGAYSQTLSDVFTMLGLRITSVDPSSATNTGVSPAITLVGENFQSSMTVKLSKTGQSDIPGIGLFVPTQTGATVQFDLTGVKGGRWDVIVTLGDGSFTLSRGFAVLSNDFKIEPTDPTQSETFTLVSIAGNQSVVWPPGITSQSIELDLDAGPILASINSSVDPYQSTGLGIEITPTPTSTTLSTSFQLTLPYRLSDLPDSTKEDALTIAVYNTVTGRWEPLPSTVDTSAKTVTAYPTHLSLFAIVQHTASANLNGAIAFPNPFRVDRGHTRIVFDFLTPGARARVFDTSGMLVADLSDSNQDGQILWAGTNDSGEKLASGIYFYLITDGSGNKQTGRLGIIR